MKRDKVPAKVKGNLWLKKYGRNKVMSLLQCERGGGHIIK